MYLNSENWLKASVEYENNKIQRLGSVVTNNGYSDWASVDIDAAQKSIWFRLSRRDDDFCIEKVQKNLLLKLHLQTWKLQNVNGYLMTDRHLMKNNIIVFELTQFFRVSHLQTAHQSFIIFIGLYTM